MLIAVVGGTGTLGRPTCRALEQRGHEVRELARLWRAASRRRALLVPVPLPGRLGRALRAGELTEDHPDQRTATTFADWLAARPAG